MTENTNQNNKQYRLVMRLLLILALTISINCFATKTNWDSDKSEWTPIMKATYHSNYKRIHKLISNNCDLDYVSRNGNSALLIAIKIQDSIAVDILLKSKKITISEFPNIINIAAFYDNVYIARKLYEYGFPINKDSTNQVIFNACIFGSYNMLKFVILELIQDVNAQSIIDGDTPLMMTVQNGDIDKVKLLLNNGANKDIVNKNNMKAVDYIIYIPNSLNIPIKIKKEIYDLVKL